MKRESLLSERDLIRYHRQIMIEEIGKPGQEKLRNSVILLAGAGGLGSCAAFYLAAAGVGTIHLIDNDKVDLSNLNRQILHGQGALGEKKITSAFSTLNDLNSDIDVKITDETITEENISHIAKEAHLIVDGLDNLPTRLILNRFSHEKKIPLIHGAVRGFEGRIMTIVPGKTACLDCIYKGPIPKETFPVIGAAPGVIGSLQAMEAIKYITGTGELLMNRMLLFDGLSMHFTEFRIKPNPKCRVCSNSRE